MKWFVRLFPLIVCLALGSTLSAATIAINFNDTTGETLGNPPWSLGWSFVTNQAIEVTDLGVFDDSQDGLAESHDVGLWDSNGVLLASATVGSGTSASLVDKFRMVSIPGVQLSAGQTYYIGGVWASGADNLLFPNYASGFTVAPQIAFRQSQYAGGGALTWPVESVGGNGYFGPNFQFGGVGNVPEPSTLILLGGSLLALAALRRRG